MPWVTVEYPLQHAESPDCQHPGCIFGAAARFSSTFEAPERKDRRIRTITLCHQHADAMRSKIASQKGGVPILPAAPVEDELPTPKRPPKIFEIPTDARVTSCRSCGESIAFVISDAGNPTPVEVFGDHRGHAHFIYCPNAAQHRRRA